MGDINKMADKNYYTDNENLADLNKMADTESDYTDNENLWGTEEI